MSINRRIFLNTLAVAAASSLISPTADAADITMQSSSPNPRIRRIKAGALDVAYLESGPVDGAVVILLHGFPYDVHAFDEVACCLASAKRRVLVPYLRGYGPTRFLDSATPRVGQQAALGNDLLAFLDALGIEQATLAGFDWGARAACVVAALQPARVRGLVTSGGPGYNIQNLNEFLSPREPQWERNHWFYWYLNSKRGMLAFSGKTINFCQYLWQAFSPTWRFNDKTFASSAGSFANPDFVEIALHSYRYRIGEVPGDPMFDATEHYLSTTPSITVPTIVIAGADDGVDPPESAARTRSHFTDLRRFTVLEGVGHNVPQEAPNMFADAILQFGER